MPTPRWPVLFGLVSAAALIFGLFGGLTPASAESEPTASLKPLPARMKQSGCPTCHGNPAIAAATASQPDPRPDLYVPADLVLDSVHSGFSCTSCHPRLTSVIHEDTARDLAAARASCSKCHEEAVDLYKKSVHSSNSEIPVAWALPKTDGHAAPSHQKDDETPKFRPSCVTCHSAHDIKPATTRSFAVESADRCATCHVSRGESFFERNYHGKGAVLGRDDIAGCADCHGSHGVLSADNPASMVAEENRLETCQSCHPTATDNFGDIQVHLAGPLPKDPKLAAVMAVMTLLVVMTFAMFGTHTILDMRHAWRGHQKASGPKDGNHE